MSLIHCVTPDTTYSYNDLIYSKWGAAEFHIICSASTDIYREVHKNDRERKARI